MNKFFIKSIISTLMFITSLHAAEKVPGLKNLCIRVGIKLSDDDLLKSLDQLTDDCLEPILIEKIAAKMRAAPNSKPEIIDKVYLPIEALAITPDGNEIFASVEPMNSLSQRKIAYWNLSTESNRILDITENKIETMAVSADGKNLFFGTDEGLWLINDNMQVPLFVKGSFVAMSVDGRRGLSGGITDQPLTVWHFNESLMESEAIDVSAVAMNAAGTKGAYALLENTIKVIDLDALEETAVLAGHTAFIEGLAMTSNGKQLISCSQDKTVKVWNLEDGTSITLPPFDEQIHSVGITDNGKLCLSSSDTIIQIWNLERQKEIITLRLNDVTDDIVDAVITADGSRVVTASLNGVLMIWDLGLLLFEKFRKQFSVQGLKKLYQQLQNNDKESIYSWIVEELERAKKEEQERARKAALARIKREPFKETEHQEKRPKKDE